jgi:hypothetical protein
MIVDIGLLWTAAGVLIGLQVTMFAARIGREISVGDTGGRTWLMLADVLNLGSLVVAAAGVFLAPILAIGGSQTPAKAFGLSVLLLCGYPFALAGHYEMYNPRTARSSAYCPKQERVVLSIVAFAVAVYLAMAITR